MAFSDESLKKSQQYRLSGANLLQFIFSSKGEGTSLEGNMKIGKAS